MNPTTIILLSIGGMLLGHLLFYHFNIGLKKGKYVAINLAIIKLLAIGVTGITVVPGIVADQGYPLAGLLMNICSGALVAYVIYHFQFNKWWYLVLGITAISLGDCLYRLLA
jgi:hypothetical protein